MKEKYIEKSNKAINITRVEYQENFKVLKKETMEFILSKLINSPF